MSEMYHREIKITLSTCLAKPDLDISRDVDLEDDAAAVKELEKLAATLRDEVFPMIRGLAIPANVSAGDHPLIQVVIDYLEVRDIVTSLSITSTETLSFAERAVPLHQAIAAALNAFRKRYAIFAESDDQ